MNHFFAIGLLISLCSLPAFGSPALPTIAETQAWLQAKGAIDQGTDLKDLKILRLNKNPNRVVVDSDFTYIATLCQHAPIEEIDLRFQDQITGKGFYDLQDNCPTWTSVKVLDLAETAFDEQYFPALAIFPNTSVLNMDGTPITGRYLAAVNFIQLTSFWAYGSSINDDSLSQLIPYSQLQDINLSGTKVTDAGLQSLVDHRDSWPNLQTLYLNDLDLGVEPVNALFNSFRGVTIAISLGRFPVADIISLLGIMGNQEILNLSSSGIGDSGLSAIMRFVKEQNFTPRVLQISQSRLTLQSLESIKDLVSLEDVYWASVDDEDLPELANARLSAELKTAFNNSRVAAGLETVRFRTGF